MILSGISVHNKRERIERVFEMTRSFDDEVIIANKVLIMDESMSIGIKLEEANGILSEL